MPHYYFAFRLRLKDPCRLKEKDILLIKFKNAHMMFLLQIDRYVNLDHDFNLKSFLITSKTNVTQC